MYAYARDALAVSRQNLFAPKLMPWSFIPLLLISSHPTKHCMCSVCNDIELLLLDEASILFLIYAFFQHNGKSALLYLRKRYICNKDVSNRYIFLLIISSWIHICHKKMALYCTWGYILFFFNEFAYNVKFYNTDKFVGIWAVQYFVPHTNWALLNTDLRQRFRGSHCS